MSKVIREHITLHVDPETKQLAQRAAAAMGCASLSEFLLYLIRDNAPLILQEKISMTLDHAHFDRFVAVCNAHPIVPARLKEAAEQLDQEGF